MGDAGEGWAWLWRGVLSAGAVRRGVLDPDALDRVVRARLVIETRFDEDLVLDDLARAACWSRFHFLRQFRRAYADTPHRLLAERRLREARRLLATTDLPVTDVCLRVGYRSLGSFSRTFRDAVGEPPIGYRRRVYPSVAVRPPARIPGCFVKLWVG